MHIDKDILFYIPNLAFIPIAFAMIVGLRKVKFTANEKWIVVLTGIACVSQIVSTILWNKQMNNILVSHIYSILEFTLLIFYFTSYFTRNLRKWAVVLTTLFTCIVIVRAFVFHNPFEMNWVPRTIESAVMIAISLFMYGFIMKTSSGINIWNQPLFWINSAALLYFSSNLLLFYFSSYVAQLSYNLNITIWVMHVIFMTLYYLLISIGLWKTPRIQPSSI